MVFIIPSSILLGEKCCETKDSLAVVHLLRAPRWPVIEKLCATEPTVGWGAIPEKIIVDSRIQREFNSKGTSKEYHWYR